MFSKRLTIALVLASLCPLAVSSATAGGHKSSLKGQRHPAQAKVRAMAYAMTDDRPVSGMAAGSQSQKPRIALGETFSGLSTGSPGLVFGETYWDAQHYGSMGRMITTSSMYGPTGPAMVHFGWTYGPNPDYSERSYAYNGYEAEMGSFWGVTILHDPMYQYSGWVNVDVTPDSRAVVGGHLALLPHLYTYQPQIHFDACPGCRDFSNFIRVPDSTASYELEYASGEAMWPKFFMQFSTDTVVHVIAQVWDTYRWQNTLMYLQHVGDEWSGAWSYPPYIVDTIPTYSQDICGQRTGNRAAITWTAGLPYQDPGCDTCSGTSIYQDFEIGRMDNDVYVQFSDDQGYTWQPRVNITQSPIGAAGDKAYCDLSALYGNDDVFHVVWNAIPWPSDTCVDEGGFCWTVENWYPDKSRIVHWSEEHPYIRTIADHTYIPSDSCGPPRWATTVAKMTLSECNEKLYCIWSQFNDIPGGIDNDCAQWGYDQGEYFGSANADIWLAVSNDGGLTWDAQRNLTNTQTPNCDPNGGLECENDYYASMPPYGRQNQTGENWSGAWIVDPSGGSSTDWHLDVMYLNDKDAGAAILEEGTWTVSPLKWFRVPCVEPEPSAKFSSSLREIGYPSWGHLGEQKDTTVRLENIGNITLIYNITVEEDNGPAGWLTYGGYTGSVSSGLSNWEDLVIYLNTGGVETTQEVLRGRLVFTGNSSDLPTTIEIEYIVADTVHIPIWSVINTPTQPPTDGGNLFASSADPGILSLICGSDGSVSKENRAGKTMDYYGEDCDTTAKIYMYDGSVVLGRNGGTEWSSMLWGLNANDESGMRQQAGSRYTIQCRNLCGQVFHTGTFTTYDSTIAFEKIYVAPQTDYGYIIEYLRVWSYDGGTHTGLTVGEVIDWDVPGDRTISGSESSRIGNTGSVDATRNLLYQQGYESYADGGEYPFNCQYNDERFAGLAFIESSLSTVMDATTPYGGFIAENDQMEGGQRGFIADSMWVKMSAGGFSVSDSTEDLHTGICYTNDLTLGQFDSEADVYEVVTVLATIKQGTLTDLQDAIDRATAWYYAWGGMSMFADGNDDGIMDGCNACCEVSGDINRSGSVNSADAIYFVDWLWKSGPPPPCSEEADINGNCAVNSADLIYLVDFLWKGGPAPVPCE